MATAPQYGLTEDERRRRRVQYRIAYLKFHGGYTYEEALLVAQYLESLRKENASQT